MLPSNGKNHRFPLLELRGFVAFACQTRGKCEDQDQDQDQDVEHA